VTPDTLLAQLALQQCSLLDIVNGVSEQDYRNDALWSFDGRCWKSENPVDHPDQSAARSLLLI
jgi:hypothetical protein